MSIKSLRYEFVKRAIDICVASAGLIVLSPLLAIVAGLVALNLGRPIIFSQQRPGRDGKVFRLYKFRTMKDVDVPGGLISDEQRLTPFGVALRSTSLDELPTLVNVLQGAMSIIGPRPLLVRYLALYSSEQARRHGVRPGITGLAQVNGRNILGWEEKFAFDVDYVDQCSFILDCHILGKTLRSVVKRSGISADGHVTAPEFTGLSEKKLVT